MGLAVISILVDGESIAKHPAQVYPFNRIVEANTRPSNLCSSKLLPCIISRVYIGRGIDRDVGRKFVIYDATVDTSRRLPPDTGPFRLRDAPFPSARTTTHSPPNTHCLHRNFQFWRLRLEKVRRLSGHAEVLRTRLYGGRDCGSCPECGIPRICDMVRRQSSRGI